MSDYPPIEMVEYAAEKLGDLLREFVFLGGAVVGLLVTEPGSRPARPTKDVDVTVEVGSVNEFYALDRALLSKGFINDMQGPMCRYLQGWLKLDVMPANRRVLGFTNRWYTLAIATSEPQRLRNGSTINLISSACFLATKLEAFYDPHREGHGDIFTSRDFADIVSVIDGRSSIVNDVFESPPDIRDFVGASFAKILSENYLEEAIAEYVDQEREEIVASRLRSIVAV